MTITNNIKSIGFEAEGGINQRDYDNLRNDIQTNGLSGHFEVKDDETVQVRDREISGREYNYWSDDLKNIQKFLKLLYKHGFKSNESCGFHVHVRFKDNQKAVSYFSFDKFLKRFLKNYTESFKEIPKYMERKTNGFCSSKGLKNRLKEQLKGGKYRRTAINLVSLTEPQNTIEFRIFPYQESQREAMDTISWLILTLERIFEKELIYEEEINVLDRVNGDNNV